MVAVAIGGAALVGVAGSAISSSNSADAATSAAQTQADAANKATDTQLQMFQQTQQNLQPFVGAGQQAIPGLVGQVNKSFLDAPANAPSAGNFVSGTAPPDISTFGKNFQTSPGYAFQMQQGIDAIDNSAAAAGGLKSGNTLKALDKFGQGVANQDFYNQYNAANQQYWNQYNSAAQQYWNQYNAGQAKENQGIGFLQNLVGSGQNAAANLGTNAMTTGANVGNTQIQAGNAIAAGTVGSANAFNQGMSSISNIGNNAAQSYLLYNSLNPSSYTGALNAGAGAGAVPGLTGGY